MRVRAALVVVASLAALATAGDGPAPAPKKTPLALLRKAATRQGGAELAAAGGIRSMHIEFGAARGWAEVTGKDGKVSRPDFDLEELSLDWLRHDDGSTSLRTRSVSDGLVEIAAINGAYDDIGWVSIDGEVETLSRAQHPEQLRRLTQQRRIIDLLAEAMLLSPLDDEQWMPLPTSSNVKVLQAENVKIEQPRTRFIRIGAADAADVIVVGVDQTSHDVTWVQLPERDTVPCVTYELAYHPTLPHRSTTAPRMPFKITDTVSDTVGTAKRPRLVLGVSRVALNEVDIRVLVQPKPKND